MSFDSNVWNENKLRYPRHDLFVIMTVNNAQVKYLSVNHSKDKFYRIFNESALLSESPAEALVIDDFNLANQIFTDMQLDSSDDHFYIVPLSAVQILTGIGGGVSPTNTVIRWDDVGIQPDEPKQMRTVASTIGSRLIESKHADAMKEINEWIDKRKSENRQPIIINIETVTDTYNQFKGVRFYYSLTSNNDS